MFLKIVGFLDVALAAGFGVFAIERMHGQELVVALVAVSALLQVGIRLWVDDDADRS